MSKLCWSLTLCILLTSACNKATPAAKAAADGGAAKSYGQQGETCTAHADCAPSLSCLHGVCAPPSSGGKGDAGGMVTPVQLGGEIGESCTARRDCKDGLACIGNQCVGAADAGAAPALGDRGAKGESCTARTDCVEGLACLAGMCRDNSVGFAKLPKQCHDIQCSVDKDCCEGFPLTTPACMQYQTDCASGTMPNACTYYKQTCQCTEVCSKEQLCVPDTSCTADLDCTNFLTPHCLAKTCVECIMDTDCTGTDQTCVDHACKKPCTKDEECPFSDGAGGMPITITTCTTGKCVERPCMSDRECYFASGDHTAKCSDKKCILPCQHDSDCLAAFNICDKGLCSFVGCQTDAECRLALHLGTPDTKSTAVCK